MFGFDLRQAQGQSECSTFEPGTRAKIATKGWIETKSRPKTERLYRLTEEGLEAKKLPTNPTEKATEYSKGK